ncbi:MAG: tRNA (guanosine(46)-N7)-methyltransferase TrmB [Lachnospiraceae bacterium]|nr:tRNA (guanosine(46)-N7)-methyltransferase TrmB [Lachnospiraceae bacterium]
MRLRNIPGADEAVANSPFCITLNDAMKHHIKEQFPTDAPIHMEIGMGKGQFIMELAKQHPEINYIGMERYSSVLLRALQKMDELEQPLTNLKFICQDAKLLPEYFSLGDVKKIYLNFSDPWPKDRHAKRRLTSRQFLSCYDKFLALDGSIEFKTDNVDLFRFSLNEIEETNWILKAHTFDLHHDPVLNQGNIMTEYEEKFSSMGNPICKLITYRDHTL